MSDRFATIVRAAFPPEKAEQILHEDKDNPVRVQGDQDEREMNALFFVLRVGLGALILVMVW